MLQVVFELQKLPGLKLKLQNQRIKNPAEIEKSTHGWSASTAEEGGFLSGVGVFLCFLGIFLLFLECPTTLIIYLLKRSRFQCFATLTAEKLFITKFCFLKGFAKHIMKTQPSKNQFQRLLTRKKHPYLVSFPSKKKFF